MSWRKICHFLILILISTASFGQNSNPDNWNSIETAILTRKNLSDTRDQLLKIRSRAIESQNEVVAARCYSNLLAIADLKSEDSLFFKNALFMDSTLNDPKSSLLMKSIMHVLLARRIHAFTNKFYYRSNKNTIRCHYPQEEYNKMPLNTLDSLINDHINKAIAISKLLHRPQTEEILWLSSDPLLFLFKPDFTDILYAERIFMNQGSAGKHTGKISSNWVSESQDDFIRNSDQIKDLTPHERTLLGLYRDWMQYRQNGHAEAFYFIETLARKFLYHNLYEDSAFEKAYVKYLEPLLLSPYNAVKIHAVYQLCMLWNDDASRYNPTMNAYLHYNVRNSQVPFNNNYRLCYNKIIALLGANEHLLDSFDFIRSRLLEIRSSILAPGLQISTYVNQLPETAIPAFIKYRNIDRLFTRVIRISPFETLYTDHKKNLQWFGRMPVFTERMQSLTTYTDHQWHSAFLKWDALPAGHYIVLYSDSSISEKPDRAEYIEIDVTSIAVINNDQRVFVLNRKTGFPLIGAQVLAEVSHTETVNGITKTIRSTLPPKMPNKQGYVLVGEKNVTGIRVYSGRDSVEALMNKPQTRIPDELYNKDNYDNLEEYYEDNISLELFTDRSIYRPGQTVYYKGIFTTRNPKTGELLVLNWKNLRFSFFKKLFYKTVLKFTGQKIEISIKDPFNREVDTLRVMPNKFGSFAGSFKIPANAATGEWNFDTDDFTMGNRNDGTFHVEEYKRPAFKLTLEKPKNILQIGDSFRVKMLARSFAGAPLGHVLIRYHVHRNGNLPKKDKTGEITESGYQDVEIMSGESFSNDHGEVILTVTDTGLARLQINDDKKYSLEYSIIAEATDETGESHEENLSFSLSNRPVIINVPVPAFMDRNNISPVYISTSSDFVGPLKKQVEISIFKKDARSNLVTGNEWPAVDTWIFSKEALANWFPEIDFAGKVQTESKKRLVFKTMFQAGGDQKFNLPENLLQAGNYEMETVCREGDRIKGETTSQFSIFDKVSDSLPEKTNSFEWLPVNTAASGETITWITGNSEKNIFSIYHVTYQVKGKKGAGIRYDYYIREDKKGINEWKYKIPPGVTNRVVLTHLYIFDNKLYRQEHWINIPYDNTAHPEIIIEKYRTKLAPGEKETFTVSIKTKNEETAAELMTTMYDASLDKLEPHNWNIPQNKDYYFTDNSWNREINYSINNSLLKDNIFSAPTKKTAGSIWWISGDSMISSNFSQSYGIIDLDASRMLQGSVAGLSILQSGGLNDVVVVGYGTSTRRNLTGGALTTVRIRGISSLQGYIQPLIILDGLPYTGDISQINPGGIYQAIVLKGADAEALYGSKAANGVLIISTKGPVVLPSPKEPPPPSLVIRKNFAETAFFYPQIHAGRDGLYSISFTLPESVTEWKWKLLAHTRKAGFAYAEKSIFSQLPLMIQPAVPRFLYQGDQMILKTRITNLDTSNLEGELKCKIEDLVTGEDISAALLKQSHQPFRVKHESNTAGTFLISIPQNLLHPIRIRVNGTSNTFSDGEEHIIPVLSKKFLVTKTTPFLLKDTAALTVRIPSIPEDAEAYGISLFIKPKPQAAMLNALPFLALDPYGCAEQTLNKIMAYSLAVKISRTDTILRSGIIKFPEAVKNAEQQDTDPDEQMMPWLQLNHATALQHQKLKKLFDTAAAQLQIEKYFSEILDIQKSDGSMSWFKNGPVDPYISLYVLAGFGEMLNDHLLYLNNSVKNRFPGFISGLIHYCDDQFASDSGSPDWSAWLYARSFWLKEFPLSRAKKEKADSLAGRYWNGGDKGNLYRQAISIILTLRFFEKGSLHYQHALQQLEAMRQLAIPDDGNGIRWRDISNADDLNRQSEESLAKIAAAFEEGGNSKTTVSGIVQWLLASRKDHAWSTSKSTAAIVSLLHRQNPETTGESQRLLSVINGDSLLVTNDLFNGKLSAFSNLSGRQFPSDLTIRSSASVPAAGGINYYYFTSKPSDTLHSGIQIVKRIFRYNDSAKTWDPVPVTGRVKIADKIKTELRIETGRKLTYLYINDRRAATLEPKETNSGYEYADGFSYYRSVKDAGALFFIAQLPSGVHTISYESVVAAEGRFTNGPAALQCMYQPELNAFSNSIKIEVE